MYEGISRQQQCHVSRPKVPFETIGRKSSCLASQSDGKSQQYTFIVQSLMPQQSGHRLIMSCRSWASPFRGDIASSFTSCAHECPHAYAGARIGAKGRCGPLAASSTFSN